MATNVINIREFVDVSTSVAATPVNVARDWGALLFVQKGTNGATTTTTTYDDLQALLDAASNTEAAKAATVFYGTGYNGITPTSPITVAIIGAADASEFTTNFTALLGSEAYYHIVLDTGFSVDMQKAAAAAVEAANANTAHMLYLDDHSTDAITKDLASDSTSIAAYCANNNYSHTTVCWSESTNENKYYSAAMASFFATRRFDGSSRMMCSIAHKRASGIAPVDLTITVANDTSSPTQRFKNLDAKNCNVYANIKIVGLPAWERGNLPSGDDVSDFISADYLNYRVSVAVFQLLQSVPRLAMNQDGAVLLHNTLVMCLTELSSAGIISGGVALDGDVIPNPGYKISIPLPTGVARANGLWEGIYCVGLLTGSAKKVVIGNELKK